MQNKKEYIFNELPEKVQRHMIREMKESAINDLINNDIPDAICYELEMEGIDLCIDSDFIRDIYECKVDIQDYVINGLEDIGEDFNEEKVSKIIEIIKQNINCYINDPYLDMVIENILFENTDSKYTIEENIV